MANTFLTTDLIAPETLPSLIDNLVMPNLMYKDYANVFADEGDQIRVERPVVFIADEFGGTINLQDINEKYVFVTMDKIADVSMEITQSDLSLSAEDFAMKYSQPAAEAIAEKINDDGLDVYKYVYSFEGTSGTTPDALADLANARKRLNINKVPLMNRNAVWDPEADAKFSTLDAIAGLDKSGSTQALREGSIGRVSGLDNYMSQAVKTHTAGLFTALTDVTATVAITSNGNDTTTNLETSDVVLTSAAGTSTDTLLKGDLLQFADDNGKVYQCTVVADTAAAVAGVVTAKVHPALDADATATDVTFPDETAGGHVANLAFHEKAFGFVTRPMAPLAGQDSFTMEYNGIAMRVTIGSDISTKKTTMSIDTLYGIAPLYPTLATRILG